MANLVFKTKYRTPFLIIAIFFILEFILLRNTPFFWDAVSKSLRANWFYDCNFQQFIIPTEINSGHPPLWTLLLSFWWKIFGKTLISSRFLLLLINMLVGYQVLKLFRNIFDKDVSIILILLVFLEPTLLAQTTIMNNDMLLLLFTLLAFNIIYKSQKSTQLLLTIALTGILFSNLRGMLIFVCILIVDILYIRFKFNKNRRIRFFPYLISAVLLGLFFLYQYNLLGWIIKTPSLNWSGQRENASLLHILKNIASVIRNFMDYGRVVLIAILVIFLIKFYKKEKFNYDEVTKKLIISTLVFSVGLSLFFIFFTNPIGHRYYMMAYILLVLLFLKLLFLVVDKTKIKVYIIAVGIAFITGHFWIYPSTISQGWDSSLAYLNYFESRNNIQEYIDLNKISRSEIGTNLPLNSVEYSDLVYMGISQEKYIELDLKTNKYIILSNIENDTSDEDIHTLLNDWIVLKEYSNFGVYVILFRNPNM